MHDVSVPTLYSGAMSTASSGSMLLACVGRGNVGAHTSPTDNKGNVFAQIGSPQVYSLWTGSGTALYACAPTVGGTNHVVRATKLSQYDETTMSVVEIRNGGNLKDVKWREALAGNPLTSASVTTTGPALLVAWWWGDADVGSDKTAVPNNGFTVIHSILKAGALVQCCVAVRQVSAAGTYNVTWAATPTQGAQLWIAAIQAS
ncbi:MAG: hypothetical protein HZC37_20890 [Burkholderiales bacterium]|nr:hypothetical protein [Burkholderiales bacterium]